MPPDIMYSVLNCLVELTLKDALYRTHTVLYHWVSVCCILVKTGLCCTIIYVCDYIRLIHDRELSLFDGTRLLRHDRFEEFKEKLSLTDAEMNSR